MFGENFGETMLTNQYCCYSFPVCNEESDGTWTPPPGWTGPDAAFYRSFNTMGDLVLMEGIQQTEYTPLVPGQVTFIEH